MISPPDAAAVHFRVCDKVVHCAISERRLLSQRFASVVTAHQHHSHVTPLMAQFWLGGRGGSCSRSRVLAASSWVQRLIVSILVCYSTCSFHPL